jgi:hypothetical protein
MEPFESIVSRVLSKKYVCLTKTDQPDEEAWDNAHVRVGISEAVFSDEADDVIIQWSRGGINADQSIVLDIHEAKELLKFLSEKLNGQTI